MLPAIRRLLAVGIGLTLVGLVGLAVSVTRPGTAWVRYVFIPCYVIGAALLIGGGTWWLVRYTRK